VNIKDLILKLKGGNTTPLISSKVDVAEGVDFIFSQKAIQDLELSAINDPLFGMQLTHLRGLHEQGLAEQNANGYTVLSENIVEQDDYFFDLFSLPEAYQGSFAADIRGNTAQAAFSVELNLILKDGSIIQHYQLYGPFLKVSDTEQFRVSPAEFKALNAIEHHKSLNAESKGEYENNWLLFQLQLAKKAGMNINLGHFNNLELLHPESVGVALEETPDGDLILTPTYGAGIDLNDIQSRLGQIDSNNHHSIFRVKNRFVLLDEERLEASHEILTNRRIPKNQVERFLKAPTSYLSSALIDLDTGFSLRVHGAEKFIHRYFGDVEESGIDWFNGSNGDVQPFEKIISAIDSEDVHTELTQKVADAKEKGADVIEFDGQSYDISEADKVEQALATAKNRAVVAIVSNDEYTEFSRVNDIQTLNIDSQTYATDNLKRSPFEHQDEGIKWLLAHYELALKIESQSGALLADDMGLGKTYMTLASIAEWYRRCKSANSTLKPVLIVAPLSLIENWQAEVEETFYKSPFTEIIVLQARGDLKRFKIAGARAETQQNFGEDQQIEDSDEIRYSLKVGSHYDDRLDKPGRLVLTTYQTLRDYQFSLSRIHWSVVAFDEAQNLKNPNALATRAAKGLNADFKLLATGTPVENTLRDFWCLLDTAVPGLLGSWQSFRKEYIVPITQANGQSANEVKLEVGAKLRQQVGSYMLRRTKEDNLRGLPAKRIFTGVDDHRNQYMPALSAFMSGQQLQSYNDVISVVQSAATEDKRQVVLPSLLKLKLTSIHHDLLAEKSFSHLSHELAKKAEQSCKIQSLLSLLEDIKRRNEKVLIFATSKSVQAFVSTLITQKFKIFVQTINGETKAVSNKKDEATRKGIIDKFQSQPGFDVLIMSPVAAGVGLTVTGANNVIHLERHWNPAKEAQATDRVYRIGQKREVNVYIPIAKHPEQKSFDEHLNSLLGNKVDLSQAVVASEIVDVDQMAGIF